MSELTINQIIEWSIAILAVVAIIIAVGLFFYNKALPFLSNTNTLKLFLGLI